MPVIVRYGRPQGTPLNEDGFGFIRRSKVPLH